jgi:D-cysteine desulfhydrase
VNQLQLNHTGVKNMNLAKFPRRRYTAGQTPLEYLKRFSEAVGGPNIFVKRDDLLGLTAGGNKTRKLEFLVADALLQGADTLVTCGAVQSNHCRLTLSAAVKEGLQCHLVLEERVAGSYKPKGSGNNFLFHVLGADSISVAPGGSNMLEEMEEVAERLKAAGRKPYIIPGGGSNAIGATGYVACAEEILSQTFEMGICLSHVVTTSGSAGTHAGLAVGFYGNNSNIPVTGINISRRKEAQENLVFDLARKTAERLGLQTALPRESIVCFDEYVGPGYSLPTDDMIAAVKLLARTEGILLDPVYTGKAMAGLIGLIKQGYFKQGDNVLFVHTGGSPALYAYDELFFE